LKPKGRLILDEGACRALVKHNRSLLPSGIKEVEGEFGVGDAVHCISHDGDNIAVGLINYSSIDIKKIQGYHSREIERILGYCDSEEVMHRDNIVLL
jgi:glutamate 5-kinase